MFNASQRDRLHEALLNRAEDTNTKRRGPHPQTRRKRSAYLRSAPRQERGATPQGEPKAADGTILKLLLDWLSNGGLAQIIALIMQFIPK